MDFYEWCIHKYLGEDTAAGDLAEDMERSTDFPRTSIKEIIESYLHSKRACYESLETFHTLFGKYKKEVLHS